MKEKSINVNFLLRGLIKIQNPFGGDNAVVASIKLFCIVRKVFLPPVESSFYRPASENKIQCRQKLSNDQNKNQLLYPKSISHRYCVINFIKNCHFTVHVQVELTSF